MLVMQYIYCTLHRHMKYTDKELHECALAIGMARESGLNLLDAVKEQVRAEEARKRMSEVSAVVELFLQDKAATGNAYTTMKNMRSVIYRFSETFNGRLMDEVTHSEVKEWINGRDVATTTKNNYVKEVKSLFNWAIREGMAEVNPTQRIAKYRHSISELEAKESAKEILTVNEVDTMLDWASTECPQAIPRMSIMLYAGTRPGRESESLTIDNIYMDDRIIHVPASKAKDRKERFIDICDKLYGVLGWMYQSQLDVHSEHWEPQWEDLKRSVGLGGQWPNSCTRHTFASYNLAKFGDVSTKSALGHGSYDMLFKHYRTLVRPAEADAYFNNENNFLAKAA